MSSERRSLQQRYAPTSRCFGCGPANDQGLQIRSFPTAAAAHAPVLAEWRPEKHHEAFDGVVNGGILGALLDCHSNWTAAWHLMQRDGLERPPCTVTADFHVRLRRPTPSDRPLSLSARAVSSQGKEVEVEAVVTCDGRETATCRGKFVAVGPGHPAYHRWDETSEASEGT